MSVGLKKKFVGLVGKTRYDTNFFLDFVLIGSSRHNHCFDYCSYFCTVSVCLHPTGHFDFSNRKVDKLSIVCATVLGRVLNRKT